MTFWWNKHSSSLKLLFNPNKKKKKLHSYLNGTKSKQFLVIDVEFDRHNCISSSAINSPQHQNYIFRIYTLYIYTYTYIWSIESSLTNNLNGNVNIWRFLCEQKTLPVGIQKKLRLYIKYGYIYIYICSSLWRSVNIKRSNFFIGTRTKNTLFAVLGISSSVI